MFLEIVFSRDFDPNTFAGYDCKVRGNIVTARGTLEELNRIIGVADSVLGDKTIIMRRSNNEEKKT